MEDELEDRDDDDDDNNVVTSVKLFAIQKTVIQRLAIKYTAKHSVDIPPSSFSTAASASSQEDLLSLKDGLSDIDCTDVSVLHDKHDSIRSSSSITAVTTLN